MKKFFYIALKQGETCDGIIRAESIDSARRKLVREGLEDINLVILQSDKVEFLDLDGHGHIEECAK